ncbi:MAG: TraM recognition domain-containing protein, partial [Atopobiaceae bacterium]|nr:TraM recognition domain-containing protein [Atopobiaceae bacterium]
LDDFANLRINDMDDVLAVARSRELWITIICQSVTQLRSIYGEAKAASIIGNCDMQVLLGTRDYETAQYYSAYADVPASNLLHIPLEKEWLFVRGQRARMAEKLDVSEHPLYKELVAGRACPQPTI